MNCEQVEMLLTLLVLGELEGQEKRELLVHLQGCPACKEKLGDLRVTLQLLRDAVMTEPAPKLGDERRAALMTTVSQEQRNKQKLKTPARPRAMKGRVVGWITQGGWRRRVSIAAGLALAGLIGALIFSGLLGDRSYAPPAILARRTDGMAAARMADSETAQLPRAPSQSISGYAAGEAPQAPSAPPASMNGLRGRAVFGLPAAGGRASTLPVWSGRGYGGGGMGGMGGGGFGGGGTPGTRGYAIAGRPGGGPPGSAGRSERFRATVSDRAIPGNRDGAFGTPKGPTAVGGARGGRDLLYVDVMGRVLRKGTDVISGSAKDEYEAFKLDAAGGPDVLASSGSDVAGKDKEPQLGARFRARVPILKPGKEKRYGDVADRRAGEDRGGAPSEAASDKPIAGAEVVMGWKPGSDVDKLTAGKTYYFRVDKPTMPPKMGHAPERAKGLPVLDRDVFAPLKIRRYDLYQAGKPTMPPGKEADAPERAKELLGGVAREQGSVGEITVIADSAIISPSSEEAKRVRLGGQGKAGARKRGREVAAGATISQYGAKKAEAYLQEALHKKRVLDEQERAASHERLAITTARQYDVTDLGIQVKDQREKVREAQAARGKALGEKRGREENLKLGLFSEASAEFGKGNYNGAIALANKIMERDPDNAAARDLLASAGDQLRRRTWASVYEADKKAREDERLSLREKLVWPHVGSLFRAKEAWEERVRGEDAQVASDKEERTAKEPLPDDRSVHMQSALRMLGQDAGAEKAADESVDRDAAAAPQYVRLTPEESKELARFETQKAVAALSPALVPKEPEAIKESTPATVEDVEVPAVFEAVPVNPWVMTGADRFSTFAIDVDTASYAVARSYIRRGRLPPPASVRMEEFVNAFDYNYPSRTEGVFTVHAEAAPSPFRRGLTLVKVGIRGRVLGREARKPAHLIFVVDASGSMAKPERMPLVQYALEALTEQLGERDRVSLVTYGTQARLVLEATSAGKREDILSAIRAIRCGGSTNLLEGLRLGYVMAERAYRSGEINRVILCSDGVANVGSTAADEMLSNIEAFRNHGITFTAAGFGSGAYNDVLMEKLADNGDGNYVFVDSEAEARRVFVEEMAATLQTIAKDAKIQVEFNSARVRRYRLIGFENRAIADKDFRNDAIDAGEVGSGQSSTALYEVELLDQGADLAAAQDLGTVYVRYRNLETGEIEEISHRLASSMVKKRTPQDSPRFFLAACAATFAEILRESEHAQNVDLDAVRSVLEQVAVQLPLDARAQELLWLVNRAKGLPRAT